MCDANETYFFVSTEPFSIVSPKGKQSPQVPGQQKNRAPRHGKRPSHLSGGLLSKIKNIIAIPFVIGKKSILEVNFVKSVT